MRTIEELSIIVLAGGSIKLSANDYTIDDLKEVINKLPVDSKMYITNLDNISTRELAELARIKRYQVIFDFS